MTQKETAFSLGYFRIARCLIALSYSVAVFSLPAFAQDHLYAWTKTFSSTSGDSGYSITSDALGNVYLTGGVL
ncbi:MAG: hypothetical protein PHC51_04530 [bacterium]|nr:hypothetical protein [bacterium]